MISNQVYPLPILSKIWMGTWSLGGEKYGYCPASTAIETLQRGFELGVRHFDTAHFYSRGESNKRLYRALGSFRNEIIICSKGGLIWDQNIVCHDASYQGLKRDLSQTLESLHTDFLDYYLLHWPDPKIPILESLSALQDFYNQGLIRHWGISNLSSYQLSGIRLSDSPSLSQFHFNPLVQSQDYLIDLGLNIAYSPFEQGLLLDPNLSKRLSKKDIRRRNPRFHNPKAIEWVSNFNDYCLAHKLSPYSVNLSWILSQSQIDGIIIGARTPDQIKKLNIFLDQIPTLDVLHDFVAQWPITLLELFKSVPSIEK